MIESGMIRVLKRDGTLEKFDAHKLAGAMWRAMRGTMGQYEDACQLALAIEIYVSRGPKKTVSSVTIFEMTLKILSRVKLTGAFRTFGVHRVKRHQWRSQMCVHHGGEKATQWDKSWLAELACKSWHLMPVTGRIIAGRVENQLRRADISQISRQELLDIVNRYVAELGLADAVPVGV